MRRTVWMGASLLALSACSADSNAVGENSAGSIKTTAVGEVVANIATPTPTPAPIADTSATASNAADVAADAAVDAVDNAATTH